MASKRILKNNVIKKLLLLNSSFFCEELLINTNTKLIEAEDHKLQVGFLSLATNNEEEAHQQYE